MKKNIVHITTVHQVQDARIFFRQCRSLAEYHNVTLIAPGNNNDHLQGVHILSLGQTHNRWFRASINQIRALFKAVKLKADLYHFHDPELILTGLFLKLLGFKVIYDVHEDVPKDILLKTHIPAILRRPLARVANFFENLAAKFCDAIITVTPDIAKRFSKDKTFLVRNYPFQILPSVTYEEYSRRDIDLIYIGSITLNRGLSEIVNAAKTTEKNLVLIGNAATNLMENYLQDNSYVKHIPWMPSSQLFSYLTQSKIGLVILHPTPTFMTSYPLKMFEYMAVGIPVIASNFPEWEQLISRYECGLVVDPLDEKSIIEAILYLLNHPNEAYQMGQNGLKAIKEELNWDHELYSLLSVYEAI